MEQSGDLMTRGVRDMQQLPVLPPPRPGLAHWCQTARMSDNLPLQSDPTVSPTDHLTGTQVYVPLEIPIGHRLAPSLSKDAIGSGCGRLFTGFTYCGGGVEHRPGQGGYNAYIEDQPSPGSNLINNSFKAIQSINQSFSNHKASSLDHHIHNVLLEEFLWHLRRPGEGGDNREGREARQHAYSCSALFLVHFTGNVRARATGHLLPQVAPDHPQAPCPQRR